MHIPDNYLSPVTCAAMAAVMVPVWAVSVKKVRKDMSTENISKIGIGAAYSFAGMMFNVPVPGGTTGHAVGATLIAAVIGPHAACLAVSVALLLQALLFGDGGVLAFGANCFNMAFVMPFVGYFFASLLKKIIKGKKKDLISTAIGSYIGINTAAFMAALEFGIQPYLFKDASGQPLYCPYGLNVSIPAMALAHLTFAGAAEVIYTAAVMAFLKNTSPAVLYINRDAEIENVNRSMNHDGKKTKDISWIPLLGLIVLTPLGLIASGTAWGEWGADEIAATGIGFTPEKIKNGINYTALFPDYSLSGLPEAFGYVLSAMIGVAFLVIVFKLLSLIKKK